MVSNIDFQRGLVESRRAYDNRVLVQPNGCTAVDQQIISALWEKYTLPSAALKVEHPASGSTT